MYGSAASIRTISLMFQMALIENPLFALPFQPSTKLYHLLHQEPCWQNHGPLHGINEEDLTNEHSSFPLILSPATFLLLGVRTVTRRRSSPIFRSRCYRHLLDAVVHPQRWISLAVNPFSRRVSLKRRKLLSFSRRIMVNRALNETFSQALPTFVGKFVKYSLVSRDAYFP